MILEDIRTAILASPPPLQPLHGDVPGLREAKLLFCPELQVSGSLLLQRFVQQWSHATAEHPGPGLCVRAVRMPTKFCFAA